MDINKLKPFQEKAIINILFGKHSNYIISMASQGGKSLCYQLPALLKDKITIIFVPALALINDLLEFFKQNNISAASINSSNRSDWDDITDQLTNGCLKFFLWTPEMSYVNKGLTKIIHGLIDNDRVGYFVVEDAHYIDAMNEVTNSGVTLKEERTRVFDVLSEFRRRSQNFQWIALTTASPDYRIQLSTSLGMDNAKFLSSSSVRTNIFYKVLNKGTSSVELTKKLLNKHGNVSGIIFCNSEKQLKNVLKKLLTEGVEATGYCGNWPQENIKKWISGKAQVIVAKGESSGFGLNHFVPPSIRFVIHRYVPGNMHAYYHESGRIGNDGEMSYAYIIKEGRISDDFQPYLAENCRHQTLAEFFGETINECVDKCDFCVPNNDF